jgi:hypothetical protein
MQPSSLGDLAVGFWVAREGAFENALTDGGEIVTLDLLVELFDSATEPTVALSKTTIMINANLVLVID